MLVRSRKSAFREHPAKGGMISQQPLVVYRPKGLTVCLAQPKELQVLQGWVDHCQMVPRANGLTVRRTCVTNGQPFGPLVRGRRPNPALRIFDS